MSQQPYWEPLEAGPADEGLSARQQRAVGVGDAATGGTLIGGVGLPWLRDLDFGTQFIRRIQSLDWPDDVLIEDFSFAAHRVLHILQELKPDKLILVGAMPRFVDKAGTVRRYKLDLEPPDFDDVHERLSEAVGGVIDLDHTLAVVRYWRGFPEDTIVIEVEPGDRSFGLGFSPEVDAAIGTVLDLVREEAGAPPAELPAEVPP